MQSDHIDKVVLGQIAQGSETAFKLLFDHYRPKLYTYLCRLTKSEELAEDLLHDVFLKIWKNRTRLTEVEHLNGYIYRMAHNGAYTAFQRKAKETLILAELQKEQGREEGKEGEDKVTQSEVKAFIHEAVKQLTPQQKQVFLLSREAGLSYLEIAEQMGISSNTVKNHMAAALKFLREEIGRNYGTLAVALFVLHHLDKH